MWWQLQNQKEDNIQMLTNLILHFVPDSHVELPCWAPNVSLCQFDLRLWVYF